MLLAVDATIPGATLTQVHGWLFHVDFANPGNSTIGLGADHTPNAEITVNPFVQAWTAATYLLVPQQGTAQKLDTLGDKIMTPVVYYNDGTTESLWADQTTMLNFPNGPTAVSWYQFDVTGGVFPATPVQQQEWTNGGDGLWRWMSSIAVDAAGNTAIGYATSSDSIFAGIRYAGRLASDPPGNLAQGEAILQNGGGAQTSGFGRWGDYTYTSIDPSNGMDFWHVGEYYTATSSASWATKIGKFNFVGGGVSPTPTPTATPASCSWAAGTDLPQVGARFVGVFFPANGKFYVMGGRDVSDVEFTNPFEYDPVANTWTTKSATYPDANTNNMACSVLNDSGTDYIYCAGGSNFATQGTTGRVFRYDPVADSITTVASNWPPGDTGILPGGFSVFNNTFVILGGFDIPNGVGTDQIWQFTPNPAGWVQKSAVLPVPLGYIPTTTIGSLIYTGGGADITGGALTDTTNSFVYDPVADSINTIADIPRPTSNTRAVNFCNQMYVLGGAFNAPSNEVDIYDPVSNTWSVGIPFQTAGRNFAADTDGTNNIWKAGGYSDDGVTKIATTEIFNCPVSPCGSPSPTPTATATATPAPRATPTPRPRPTPAPRP
jgi:N-acetylneuraminic acid mutarotase